MDMHQITPEDLKKDAIERYSEMLLKPRFEGQEKFLITQLKQLQNERIFNTWTDTFYRVRPLFRDFLNNRNPKI
jgi:hypothetical protein